MCACVLQAPLAAGDVVKIDLGCHVDGYIAVAAHTLIVAPESVISGPLADVINAAYTAAEVAARLIRVGNTNKQVRDIYISYVQYIYVGVYIVHICK